MNHIKKSPVTERRGSSSTVISDLIKRKECGASLQYDCNKKGDETVAFWKLYLLIFGWCFCSVSPLIGRA